MKMDKVAVRAALSTLAAIAVLSLGLLLVVILAFPATMMTFSYKVGNDKGAMKYAYRAYETTGEVYFLGFATRVAINLDNYEDVEYYGNELLKDEEVFTQYCLDIDQKEDFENGTYEMYLAGKFAVAKYELGKKDEAQEYAFDSLEGAFPKNNAAMALLFAAMQNRDTETENAVINRIRTLTPVSEADRDYLRAFLESYDFEKTITIK